MIFISESDIFPKGKFIILAGAFSSCRKELLMKRNDIKKITLSAMFLALALVMPFLTGQIPQMGSMLCPMHIPVLLCGFFCGGPWGLIVGLLAPMLRSVIFGMPPMFPTAVCMAVELATYGLVAGTLHNKLPRVKWNVFASLITAMLVGRVVWGVAMLLCMGLDTTKFGFTAFITASVINAVPGIIVQLVLIPVIVMSLERFVKREE